MATTTTLVVVVVGLLLFASFLQTATAVKPSFEASAAGACRHVVQVLKSQTPKPHPAEIAYLMCLVERITDRSYDAGAVGKLDALENRNTSLGVWQVSELHLGSTPGCPDTPEELSHSLEKSAACALAILRGQGIKAWNPWWNPQRQCSWKRCPSTRGASGAPAAADRDGGSEENEQHEHEHGRDCQAGTCIYTTATTTTSISTRGTESGTTTCQAGTCVHGTNTYYSGTTATETGTSTTSGPTHTTEAPTTCQAGTCYHPYTTSSEGSSSSASTGSGRTPPTSRA